MGARPNPRRSGPNLHSDNLGPEGLHQGHDRDWERLDPLIHERMRLAIVSALSVNESMTFVELKEMLGATDGNLSVHARKLEKAGYLRCSKSFRSRVPRTEYSLTDIGAEEFNRYLSHMESLIKATRGES